RIKRLGSTPNVLVVRNDGLGDFILTLPLIAAIKAQRPKARVTVLASRAMLPLVEMLPDLDAALPDEGVLLKRHRERFSAAERKAREAELFQAVRDGGFDAALVVYAESATARLIHRAGIALRAGPLRPFSWRFNAFFARSRKRSLHPEYTLNLGYLPLLGLEERFAQPRLRLAAVEARRGVVLHPYKRNETALSWPLERFVDLSRRLAAGGEEVTVVGDPADTPILNSQFGGQARVTVRTDLTLAQLMGQLAATRLFVGNSSGPLHLAALAGAPHIGLFPRNRVSAPSRWRTLPVSGAPANPARYLLSPEVPRECVVCERERCPHFNCMTRIGESALWEAMRGWGYTPPP
ncbi:MAG: glycosyltransferase family 9 protein, partial [Deltaproteobacteria bacterium]|nr:glycosyltransferase family 9 protein [Deltaproteobacteria bacterium]